MHLNSHIRKILISCFLNATVFKPMLDYLLTLNEWWVSKRFVISPKNNASTGKPIPCTNAKKVPIPRIHLSRFVAKRNYKVHELNFQQIHKIIKLDYMHKLELSFTNLVNETFCILTSSNSTCSEEPLFNKQIIHEKIFPFFAYISNHISSTKNHLKFRGVAPYEVLSISLPNRISCSVFISLFIKILIILPKLNAKTCSLTFQLIYSQILSHTTECFYLIFWAVYFILCY